MVTVKQFMPTRNDWLIWLVRDVLIRSLLPTLLFTVPGLFIVALLLPFLKERAATNITFPKQYEGWRNFQFPPNWKWAYIFGNEEVGGMGDKYWPELASPWMLKLGLDHPLVMWWWLAVRNPTNNFKQILGVRLLPNSEVAYAGDYEVGDTADGNIAPGWQFTRLTTGHKTYYGLYIIHVWNAKRYGRLRLGYKTKPNVDLQAIVDSGIKIGTAFVPTPYRAMPTPPPSIS